MPTIGRRFHFNYRFLLLAALVLVVAVPAFGKSDELVPGGAATVVEIVDGDTLRLHDGEQVRPLGLQAPKLPVGRRNFKTWPLDNESKDALVPDILETVTSWFRSSETGLARPGACPFACFGRYLDPGRDATFRLCPVFTLYDKRPLVDEILQLEQSARRARHGRLGHAFYRIWPAENLRGDINTFQLVEDRVRAVATFKGSTYLNLGAVFPRLWSPERIDGGSTRYVLRPVMAG